MTGHTWILSKYFLGFSSEIMKLSGLSSAMWRDRMWRWFSTVSRKLGWPQTTYVSFDKAECLARIPRSVKFQKTRWRVGAKVVHGANCERSGFQSKRIINTLNIIDIGWAATEIHRQRLLMWRSTRFRQGKTNYFEKHQRTGRETLHSPVRVRLTAVPYMPDS